MSGNFPGGALNQTRWKYFGSSPHHCHSTNSWILFPVNFEVGEKSESSQSQTWASFYYLTKLCIFLNACEQLPGGVQTPVVKWGCYVTRPYRSDQILSSAVSNSSKTSTRFIRMMLNRAHVITLILKSRISSIYRGDKYIVILTDW